MNGRSCLSVVFLGMSIATPASLIAQRVVTSLDLSGTSVWYADSLKSGGGSLSPAVRLDWSRATVSAFANVSRLGSGNSSVDGLFAPSVFTPNAGPIVGEFAGSLGGSSHQDGTRTGQFLGLARMHLMMSSGGAYLGVDAGRTWDGTIWRNIQQGELGAWLDRGGGTWLATVTPVSVADSIRYTDVQAALRYPLSAIDLGGTAGARAGSVGTAVGGTARIWGNMSVVAWVQPRIALVASAGVYPVDLTQGYPGGRFISVALRVGTRESRAAERAAVPTSSAARETPTPGATQFELRTAAGTQRVLRVYAPSATSVEINGDFTQWKALSLARGNDGWWSITLPIAAGTHQTNVRIDGGSWIAPPGLLATADEFGGVVGILVLE
jgi:hypothetical protein